MGPNNVKKAPQPASLSLAADGWRDAVSSAYHSISRRLGMTQARTRDDEGQFELVDCWCELDVLALPPASVRSGAIEPIDRLRYGRLARISTSFASEPWRPIRRCVSRFEGYFFVP